MKQFMQKLIYIISFVFIINTLYAQSLDQAKKLYNEGNYEEAKPVFERLVKQAPGNGSYNHWYGVCCFETGDLENAEKHLAAGVKRKVQESYRYLGDVYFTLYRFDEAAKMYEEYISLLSKKKQDVTAFEEKLSTAVRAQRMVERVEAVQVIDSIVVDKKDFLNAYQLSEESGTLTPFRQFFDTNEDVFSIVHMNQKGDHIYYAHPTEENGYCIFTQSRLLDKWGDEKELPANINSSRDENFPFVLTDGVTIYYASTGNGSIGGYDLFVTRYNINSETYLTPEHLGMPYNSIYNDYMMVIDEIKGLGWFVSDRFQPEDKVCIYLYIPDDNRSRIEGEEIEIKRDKAALVSIGQTWKPDTDYSALIQLAYTEIPREEEIKKDFEFVISNSLVYYTLDDIKSPEAKNYYTKVVDLNRQITNINEKLEELRTEYSQGNRQKKDQLTSSILKLEEELDSLMEQPAPLEKKARNVEINYLKINR